MGTKVNPGKFDCYAKAADDEPIFVLRANDPIASTLIAIWAMLYASNPDASDEKVHEAVNCANEMEVWHKKKERRSLLHFARLDVMEEVADLILDTAEENVKIVRDAQEKD